jgi:hypothetical protein
MSLKKPVKSSGKNFQIIKTRAKKFEASKGKKY